MITNFLYFENLYDMFALQSMKADSLDDKRKERK